jgi:hypothetical protein
VLFIASLIRSAFGFGEALVAVPILTIWIPLQSAAPLAVLASVTVALIVVAQDWKHIHIRSAVGLLLSTLLGLPIGLWLLTSTHQTALRFALGAVITLFSVYASIVRRRMHLHVESKVWMVVFGAIAGFLGGAFGMNGPALAVYGALKQWPPAKFRATLQAYFLPASTMGLIGFWRSGVWTGSVTREFLYAIPVIIPAVLIGRYISNRINQEVFSKYIYVALILVGCVLMIQSATGVGHPG